MVKSFSWIRWDADTAHDGASVGKAAPSLYDNFSGIVICVLWIRGVVVFSLKYEPQSTVQIAHRMYCRYRHET